MVWQSLAAEPRSVRFQHLSRADGLSQSFVYTIVQDDAGFMWFGTQEGLNRYDGVEFTVFAPDANESDSLSDETVRVMIKDRAGVLWVGTDAGGLSRFNADTQTFTNFLHDPGDPDSISDNRIRALFEDSSGALWIGTDGSGLDRFDAASGDFEHFAHDAADPRSLAGSQVWSIVEDSQGALWVATNAGLSVLDRGEQTFRHYRHAAGDPESISDDRARVLYKDAANTIWIGTEAGLNRFDRDSGTFRRFVHDPEDMRSISSDRIHSLFEDNAGIFWVGTVDGLNAWNPNSQSFDRYQHDPSDRYSLAQNTVLSIFQDRGGVLWIGTYDGLSRWNQATRAMLHYRHTVSDPASLSADVVTSFAENADGTIWVGTYGGGLNRLDRSTGSFEQLRHESGNDDSLSSDRIMATLVDSDGVLWAGTRASGLNRIDPATGRIDRYRHDPGDSTSIGADGITYILEDREKTLWFATFGGGISRFDPKSQRFSRYQFDPNDATTLSNDRVLVMFEDAAGQLWIGTYGGGLNRLDKASGQFERFSAEPNRPDALSSDEVYMIQEGSNGDLWIGVKDGGLNRWPHADREAGIFRVQRFSELQGLPSATIYSGQWDAAGQLWLSTARGLSRFDTETLESRNFDNSHGLQGDEFNLAAGFQTADGQLLFGGVNGFNAFYPDALIGNAVPPIAAITAVNSLNESIDLAIAEYRNGRLLIEHQQDVISFEFAALDYAASDKNRFAYKLDGFDSDWVSAGTQRHVSYTNLPPGNYTFRVRAANNDGVWSDQDAELRLYLQPALWQTWWAYLIYVLGVLALVWVAIRGYAARMERQAAIRHARDLGRLQARLTDAQRIAGMGNWEWNAASNALWFSDEIYRLLQIKPGSLGTTYDAFLQRVHPADQLKVDRAVDRVLDDQTQQLVDYRIVLPDGTLRHVHGRAEAVSDDDGNLIGMAGTVQDISDRKHAEETIRRRAEFQALLARLSADFIRALPEQLDRQLGASLASIGCHYAVDVMSIRWLDDGKEEVQALSHWSVDGFSAKGSRLAAHTSAWMEQQAQHGKPVIVDDVTNMSGAESADARFFAKHGVQSLVLIPMLVNDDVKGLLTVMKAGARREWQDETVDELVLISNTLAGAISRIRAVAETHRLRELLEEENLYLKSEIRLANRFDGIVGEDKGLKVCLQAIEKVAPTDIAVLILGETGTGKELISRETHRLSKRRDKPMISVNCPALPSTLIESELFGHEKGAFTGAHGQRRGRFELADGGTLFLDEIGELPIELQSKLLRVLQTGEFERLGGTKTLRTDVRLIAATNRDLQTGIETGEFRADLFYRISSYPVRVPPLRDRKGDIPLLAEHFVHKHAARLGKSISAISAKMMKELMSYAWPGNVRELESIIERSLISVGDGEILDLPGPLRVIAQMHQSSSGFDSEEAGELSSVERAHIVSVLEQTQWRISGAEGAASILGVPSSTLRSKMKRLGIVRGQE